MADEAPAQPTSTVINGVALRLSEETQQGLDRLKRDVERLLAEVSAGRHPSAQLVEGIDRRQDELGPQIEQALDRSPPSPSGRQAPESRYGADRIRAA